MQIQGSTPHPFMLDGEVDKACTWVRNLGTAGIALAATISFVALKLLGASTLAALFVTGVPTACLITGICIATRLTDLWEGIFESAAEAIENLSDR